MNFPLTGVIFIAGADSVSEQKNTTQKCYKVVCFLLCLFAFSCEESPQKIIEKAKKSVVTIKTPTGSGSGFVASADGLIITNNHVVENYETVEIHFPDGRTTVASPIKKGLSVLDVAYLKVDGSKFDYFPVNFNCNTGDEVYAIGAPLGLPESVSKGIISNCDRTLKGVKFIQTDAAVNAGNSGGPLINKKGEVVGLLTFKISAEGVEGLNFALSPAVVWDFYENKLTNLEEALKKEVIAQNKEVTAQNPANRSTSGEPYWVVVYENDDATHLYDVNNMNFLNENIFYAWFKSKYKTPQLTTTANKLQTESMSLFRYDCTERSFLWLEYEEVYTDGSTGKMKSHLDKIYAEPGSVQMLLMNQVCK
ncbi:MAG: serine protease [Nitrospirae bacterium]|nr:serine protease [Nitrospirota bacterium]